MALVLVSGAIVIVTPAWFVLLLIYGSDNFSREARWQYILLDYTWVTSWRKRLSSFSCTPRDQTSLPSTGTDSGRGCQTLAVSVRTEKSANPDNLR